MADLSIDFAGIKAPNPFWLASAPPWPPPPWWSARSLCPTSSQPAPPAS